MMKAVVTESTGGCVPATPKETPITKERIHPEMMAGCENHKLYEIDYGIREWWVATSANDLANMWKAHVNSAEGVDKGLTLEEVFALEDAKEYMGNKDFWFRDDDENIQVATADEWARSHPRGFFATSEY